MRTRLGWALQVLGVVFALLGLAIMVVLGPDSRRTTGPHAIETDGIAVVTAPKVISWADVQIDVLAEVPVQKPIFLGLGNSVDVKNYVSKTARLEITNFHTPWKVEQRQVPGSRSLPGAPTAVDWWIVESAGLGGASISTTLPDETVSVAVLSVGSSNLSGLTVSLAYGVKGGFAKGAGILLLGLGAVLIGLLVRRRTPLWVGDRSDDEGIDDDGIETDGVDVHEEVVYLYVDDDGVEHEISAEEAQAYEVVEHEEEPDDGQPTRPSADPDPDPDPVPREAPAAQPTTTPGVMTAGEIVGGDLPETAPAPAPAPAPATAPEPAAADESAGGDDVVYVFVDEDGVEHEVSAEDMAEFEIADEQDET